MQYRKVPKNNDQLSALGYGTMRLPTRMGQIDEERATKQIRSAIDQGINYIDTAVPYHNGKCEQFLGKALKDGYREKVKIATKLPPWSAKTREDMDRILNLQLKKLQTDHIDYYLLHGLDAHHWKKLFDLGVLDFLNKAKSSGKIINAGFSFHGDRQTFKEIVDAYDWIFCQIQYNFLDETNQAGTEGLHYAAEKKLAVMIMEPLRGGMLAANVPEPVKQIYNKSSVKMSPAEWGLRWVWNHPEVTVVLSGMNEEAHITENIRICETALPGALSGNELGTIAEAEKTFRRLMKVGCTGCAYCMPCPFGVNIPQCFLLYNRYYMGGIFIMTRGMYISDSMGVIMGKRSDASLCRNCGKCMKACPQHIAIPDELRKVHRTLGGLRTKIIIPIIRIMFKTEVKE